MEKILRPLPFVLAATNTGLMILNHLDKHETPHGTYGVGYQYLQSGSFDPQEISNVVALLDLRRKYYGDGVVALDCGANIGAHTIEWAIHMTHWGRVIAFEAQERIYYALAGNIALNNCFNAKAIFGALGNPKKSGETLGIPQADYTKAASFGSLELKEDSNNEFIGQQINYENKAQVPFLSIDSFKLNRVDLLKLDVEKMEVQVLSGALKTLKECKPILLIEILKSNKDEIFALLEPLGYVFFPMGINILAIYKDDFVLEHIKQ